MSAASPADKRGGTRERLRQAWQRLRGGVLSPGRAAASVAVGLFVGCFPIYGVQFLLVLAICLPLRLDAALAYLATQLSNPLTLPVFLAVELELGSLVLTGRHTTLRWAEIQRLGAASAGAQLAVGAALLGILLAGIGAATTWLIAHRLMDARHRELADARRRTVARYAGAPPAARSYVSVKIRTDPSLAAVAALPGNFGRTVDAGCGYFQLGLCLLELGRLETLVGIELDAARAEVAAAAARTDARVEQASLVDAELPDADTFLFVDSLHYLSLDAQDAVLERAARALSPGGRIIVREVDSGASRRSWFTELLERRAAKKRARKHRLVFRSSADLARRLTELGLEASVIQHDELSVVHNALVVGRKPL